MKFPPISKALLDVLAQAFPDKIPEKLLGPAELGVLVGEQRVIRCLQAQFKLQTKDGSLADPQP